MSFVEIVFLFFVVFFSSPNSPPKVVYSNDKFIRRFNCEKFLENDSSEGSFIAILIFCCLFYVDIFLDEEIQVATKMKGVSKKKSLDGIPFYDRKGFSLIYFY